MSNILEKLKNVFPKAPIVIGLGDELEKQVIALALKDKEFFFYLYNVLQSNHFENNINGIIWTFIKTYYKQFQVIPSNSVINNKFNEVQISYEVPEIDIHAIDYVKEKVIKVIKAQKYEEFMYKATLETLNDNPNYEELLDELKSVVYLKPQVSMGVEYFDVKNRFENLSKFWADRIPTGFPSLDKILPGGGIGRKEVIAFMGPPGVGKSLWLVNIGARAILGGYKVLHFTREVSEEITALRYDSRFLGQTTADVINNSSWSIEQIENLRQNLFGKFGDNRPLWVKEFPTGSSSIGEAQAYTQMLFDQYGFEPDIIIDDYLDLAVPMNKSSHDKEYNNQGQVFKEFRGWMVKENKCGITATQTTRDAENSKKPIRMGQTADSYNKPRILDALITINENEQDRIQGTQRLFFAKNRNAQSFLWSIFRVNKAIMLVEDMNKVCEESATPPTFEEIAKNKEGDYYDDSDIGF